MLTWTGETYSEQKPYLVHGAHEYHSIVFSFICRCEKRHFLTFYPELCQPLPRENGADLSGFFCLANGAAHVQILLPDTRTAVLLDCIRSLFIAWMIFTFPGTAEDSSSDVVFISTVLPPSTSQDSFIWCVLIGHVATFSTRYVSVFSLCLLLLRPNLHILLWGSCNCISTASAKKFNSIQTLNQCVALCMFDWLIIVNAGYYYLYFWPWKKNKDKKKADWNLILTLWKCCNIPKIRAIRPQHTPCKSLSYDFLWFVF